MGHPDDWACGARRSRAAARRAWMLLAALLMLPALTGCGADPVEASEDRIELDPRPGPHSGPHGAATYDDPGTFALSARPDPLPPSQPRSQPPEDVPAELAILVDCSSQTLALFEGERVLRRYAVSTSKVGLGNQAGSNRTPLGRHRVAQKFGDGARLGTVFRARQATKERAVVHTDSTDVAEDLVMTRILWLEGLEPGINRGRGIDSYERYIYIHGTNEEGLIGRPASHGCVRMRNRDVVELFDAVPIGTTVWIRE